MYTHVHGGREGPALWAQNHEELCANARVHGDDEWLMLRVFPSLAWRQRPVLRAAPSCVVARSPLPQPLPVARTSRATGRGASALLRGSATCECGGKGQRHVPARCYAGTPPRRFANGKAMGRGRGRGCARPEPGGAARRWSPSASTTPVPKKNRQRCWRRCVLRSCDSASIKATTR